jgi:hypothetical protein
MATIDIRATVTCSLGTLISGSVSDDYIQGSGLVKTRGNCELKGILTPAVGTVVTFSYTRDGITKKVPRKLRVLSSFADPFRQITKVALGCKLTYLENVTPAPTVDGEAAETSGRQQQCLNGYIEYPANSPVPIPVSAAGVMDTCLTRLGITASSNPLNNRFNIDTFDLSAGYVSVLSDLLLSEGYFGYLDQNEELQVCDLAQESGSGPVITADSVVDIDAIGVGELPGDAVVVRFNALKLNTNLDTADQFALEQRNWEFEETVGSPQEIDIRYTDSEGQSRTASYSYVPYSSTQTTYGEDGSWDDNVCVISSSRGEGADLSDSVVRRVTTQRTIKAESANAYCAQVLSAGGDPVGDTIGTITRTEDCEYDADGQLTRQTSRIYEPFFKWAGGIGVDFVYFTDAGSQYVTLGSAPVLVEEVVQEFETIYAPKPRVIQLKAGETFERGIEGQKVTTTTYRSWVLTIGGQQGSASIKELAPFTTASQLSTWLTNAKGRMVMVDSQVRTQRGRGGSAGQVRAPEALRIGQANGFSAETTAQLAYAMGGATSDRFVSFSMPYQSDDIFTSSGTIQRGDAEAKALRYGRIQNRLLLGNRNGVNLQLHPSKLPARPFDPFYLSNGSLMVQYRANGLNWAFSSEGIVTSVDALFWGVAGGSGTSWVPVAPGITTFPALPTVQDTTPAEVIGTVASVGSTPQTQLDAAFPSAVAGDGVQDLSTEDYWVYDGSSWSNVGPNPGPSANVASVVPPWNELVPFDGVTRTTAEVADYTYIIGVLGTTAIGPAVTRTVASVQAVFGYVSELEVKVGLGDVQATYPGAENITRTLTTQTSLRPQVVKYEAPLAVFGHVTTPFITFMRVYAGTIQKLANPASLPNVRCSDVAVSPDGSLVAFLQTSSPYLGLYTNTNYTFTKQTAPATQPDGHGQLAFSPGGNYLFTKQTFTSPYYKLYQVIGTTFQAITGGLDVTPTSGIQGFAFSPDDAMLAITYGTTLRIYRRQGNAFTSVASVTLAGNGDQVSWAPDQAYLAVGISTAPYVALYAFNGTTLTAVTGAISSPAATVAVAFSPVGNYLAISHNASPYLAFYKRNGSSFTALTTGIPASSGTAYVRSIGWTGYGDYFVAHLSTPAVRMWKVTPTTDTFTERTGVPTIAGDVYASNSMALLPWPTPVRTPAQGATTTIATSIEPSVVSFDPNDPLAFLASNALPRLGASSATSTTGWTTLYNGNVDDAFTSQVTLPFNVTISSTSSNAAFISSNSFLTFGAGSDVYTPDATFPELLKLLVAAYDYSYQAVYTKAGTGYVLLRYEGFNSASGTTAGSSNIIWEVALLAPHPTTGAQVIELRIGNHAGSLENGVLLCNTTTELTSAVPATELTSYIFQGNAAGTSWTVTANASLVTI